MGVRTSALAPRGISPTVRHRLQRLHVSDLAQRARDTDGADLLLLVRADVDRASVPFQVRAAGTLGRPAEPSQEDRYADHGWRADPRCNHSVDAVVGRSQQSFCLVRTRLDTRVQRSEEHTSALKSLM